MAAENSLLLHLLRSAWQELERAFDDGKVRVCVKTYLLFFSLPLTTFRFEQSALETCRFGFWKS